MSEPSPPAKRKRTDADVSQDQTPHRSKIWMPYGDIILQAESTQFRVNRDVLAKNSLVFQGMLTLPQPPDEAKIESCPIVQLSDSAQDVELLLSAFYDPFHHKAKLHFSVLAMSLRLGRKYEVLMFKSDATSRMHFEFPTKLSDWDRRMARNQLECIKPASGIHVDLLNLAYENGVYTSIPSLAFHCLTLYTLLFIGVKRDDGSRATLPSDTKLTLALAMERLQIFQRNNFDRLREGYVFPFVDQCESPDECEEEQRQMFRIECRRDHVDLSFTIGPWNKAGGGTWAGRLCADCDKLAQAEYNVGRSKAWETLPSFFGLGQWKDLKDMD
ncbi:hypothetical protein B0H17DRAFT_1008409 [Mycena rosella]|uniref:BTB domain-containing protein n=1 Tax=Mycena rosella TaxID=1033263 RepID=A0AAD7DN86_MYCRO|nr:hypothetical protein B0H17DRAFT_1008409 [Mycena rosella]